MQAEPKYFFKFLDAVNENGTIFYNIQVHTKGEDLEIISFRSRYSDLREIHDRLYTTHRNDLPNFPEKKLLGSTKPDFVEKRKKELENYYNTVAKTLDIDKLKELHAFLESHRKVKKPAPKPIVNNKESEETDKIEAKLKKETSLRNGFETIYKEIVDTMMDMSEDFYPPTQENFSKRFSS